MRLLFQQGVLYDGVPFLQPEIAVLDPSPASAIPQPPVLTEGELAALHAWATKHGFVLMNPRDVELAERVWRETLK
jgi:hypothetical protein